MFVRVIPKKRGNNIYYNASIVESVWDKNKKYSVHKVVKKLGSVTYEQSEKLKKAFSEKSGGIEDKLKLGLKFDIGNAFLINKIWEEWEFEKIIDKLASKNFSCKVSKILKILILNRLLFPCSEHFISEWYHELGTGIKLLEPLSKNDLHHRKLYRYTSELERIFPQIMKKLFLKLKKKIHNNNIDNVYYDITSTYFEGNTCVLAQYGYSRDKRKDKKQVVLSLVTDKYGFPIFAKVFPGNTTDNTTIDFISKQLSKEYNLKNTVIIGDRGMISNDNFQSIVENKMHYLMALSKSHITNKLSTQIKELNKMKNDEIKIIKIE
jgi:transposase